MNAIDLNAVRSGDSQENWRFILDFLPDAVMLHNGRTILHANRAACRFLKFDAPEELIGTSYLNRIHPEDRNLLLFRISEVFRGNPSSLKEYRVVDREGGVKDVEAKATMLHCDSEPCNLVIFRDITQRKAYQEELLGLNTRLREMEERQTRLARSLITSGETLRGTLAMELHDRIGQPLTSLKMDVERLLLERAAVELLGKSRVEGYIDSLRRSILDLKRMSSELLPSIIANLGLEHSLASLRDKVSGLSGMNVTLFTDGLSVHYREDVEITVYRVVQEALNNAVKHAQASNCFVNLLDDDDVLSFSVEDDGTGFDVSQKSLTGNETFSLGLHIMRERVELLGGEFSIDSEPGRGTSIVAVVPLDESMRRRVTNTTLRREE